MPSIPGTRTCNDFSIPLNPFGFVAFAVFKKVASSSPMSPMWRTSLTGFEARIRSRGSK